MNDDQAASLIAVVILGFLILFAIIGVFATIDYFAGP